MEPSRRPLGAVARFSGMRIALVAALWLLLTAMPVAAGGAELPTHGASGNFGVHTLVDTTDYPGARCVYQLDQGGGLQILMRIKVRPPIVFAFDRSKAVDRQTVSWRYRIWTANDPTVDTWQPLYKGPLQKATATDASNARFTPQTYEVPDSVHNANPHPYLLVQVVIRWYYPSSPHVDGISLILVQNYYNQTPFGDFVTSQNCVEAAT
jgi:hypothetical protein